MGQTDGVSTDDLVGLVKAAQREKVRGKTGLWNDFLEAHKKNGTKDPARQDRELLVAFVADLLVGAQTPDNADGATDKARLSGAEFVQLYLKWAKHVRKDEAKARGVLPDEPAAASNGPSQALQQVQQPPPQQQITVWSLVRRTRAHPKYGALYITLPSYRPGWKRIKRPHLPADVRPRLLAIDCEMCATEDDDSALLGVCVVDEFGAVVYRQLVRPKGKVKDLRTALTGVSEADLVGITATAKDAQRAVRALLEQEEAGSGGRPVVLVGHALHHDLAALKLDHQPVIDTSLVFRFKGLPDCTPGLKDLAKALLGLDMREGGGGAHDSREDAAVAMRLVMRELQLGAPTPPVPPPTIQVAPEDLRKLCAHALREGAGEEELRQAFAQAGLPAFSAVEAGVSGKQQLLLVFADEAQASAAFDKLPGRYSKDTRGRPFKPLSLGTSGVLCKIRLMGCRNGLTFGPNREHPLPARTPPSASLTAAAGKRRRSLALLTPQVPLKSDGNRLIGNGGSGPLAAITATAGALVANATPQRMTKRQRRSMGVGNGAAAAAAAGAGDLDPLKAMGRGGGQGQQQGQAVNGHVGGVRAGVAGTTQMANGISENMTAAAEGKDARAERREERSSKKQAAGAGDGVAQGGQQEAGGKRKRDGAEEVEPGSGMEAAEAGDKKAAKKARKVDLGDVTQQVVAAAAAPAAAEAVTATTVGPAGQGEDSGIEKRKDKSSKRGRSLGGHLGDGTVEGGVVEPGGKKARRSKVQA